MCWKYMSFECKYELEVTDHILAENDDIIEDILLYPQL